MKKTLLKTTLLCASLMLSVPAFAADTVIPTNIPANTGGYDAGLIDNSNFIQRKEYEAQTKYVETKNPAVVEAEIQKKMDLQNKFHLN